MTVSAQQLKRILVTVTLIYVSIIYSGWSEELPTYIITLKAANGKFVCADNYATVVADRNEVGEWERWELVRIDYGKVALRAYNGAYAAVDRNWITDNIKYKSQSIGKTETFGVIVADQNHIVLQTYDGKYLGVRNGSRSLYLEDSTITAVNLFEIKSLDRHYKEVDILATLSTGGALFAARESFSTKDYQKAKEQFARIYALGSNSGLTNDDKYHYAESILLSKGDTSSAIFVLQSLINSGERRDEIICRISEVMAEKNMYQQILSLPYEQMVKGWKTDQACVYRNRAWAYGQMDSTEAVIENCNLVLAQDSSDAWSYETLMNCYSDNDQDSMSNVVAKAVVQHYTTKTNPYLVGVAYYYIAEDKYIHDNYKDAIEDLKYAISFSPNDPSLYSLLGDCYSEMNDPLNACQNYRISLSKDGDNEVVKEYYDSLSCEKILEREAARVALASEYQSDWEAYLYKYPNGDSRSKVMKLLEADKKREQQEQSKKINNYLVIVANHIQRIAQQVSRWESGVQSARYDLEKVMVENTDVYTFLGGNIGIMNSAQQKKFQDLKDNLERLYYRIKRLY